MMKFTKNLGLLGLLGLTLAFSACSSKKHKDEGDTATDTSMNPTDLSAGAGTRIPELGTVYFAYDSFAISADSKGVLDANAGWLKSNPTRAIQVEGHTDERGTTEYNLALGERRAGAVKDYLVSKGVPSSQVSTISYGEERPVETGENEAAWSKNRRGEFVSAGR